jgi:hypothetical protein
MSISRDSTIFIVDSSQAIPGGTAGNFSFVMNIPKGILYDRVVMLQCIIPKSYYLVSAPLNTMVLLEPGAAPVTITLVPGDYNVLTWLPIIGALLTANSPHGWVYTITFPNSTNQVDTGKFTYTVAGNAGVQPSFIFPDFFHSTVYEQFGFNPGPVNGTNTVTFVANTLVSTNVVKFQVEDVIMVHSNMAYNNDQSSFNDVLQEIYASSTPSFSNIIYQNSGAIEAYSKTLLNRNNNVYQFILTDEHGNQLNFNGLNVVMTIMVYRKDNINDVVRKSTEMSLFERQIE